MRKRRSGNWFSKAAGLIEDIFFDFAFVVQVIGEFVIEFVVEVIC